MPSDAAISVSTQAAQMLAEITSKKTRARIRERIRALGVFPRAYPVDDSAPTRKGFEYRITFVTPYAIRYSYQPKRDSVHVDFITDERADSLTRFL